MQRASIASDHELTSFVRSFLNDNIDAAWFGVVTASCEEIRALTAPEPNPEQLRAVCIYDTSEPDNRAHAEICRARDFEHADTAELRGHLLRLFNNGSMTARDAYRTGAIWNALPQALRDRPLQAK